MFCIRVPPCWAKSFRFFYDDNFTRGKPWIKIKSNFFAYRPPRPSVYYFMCTVFIVRSAAPQTVCWYYISYFFLNGLRL